MAKTGKLKRSDRRQPEAFPIIQIDSTPSSSTTPTQSNSSTSTSNHDIHRPQQSIPAVTSKRTTNRGKSKQKDARAKAAKAIEKAEKLAHREMMVNVKADKKKRAKA